MLRLQKTLRNDVAGQALGTTSTTTSMGLCNICSAAVFYISVHAEAKLRGAGEPCGNSHPTQLPRASASSEELPVSDSGATLVILALADPHLLGSAQRAQEPRLNFRIV